MAAMKLALAERLKTYEKMKLPVIEKPQGDAMFLPAKDMAAMRIHAERRTQDELDESAGLIVFIHGEDGSARIKGGTSLKLVERVIDGSVYGKIVEGS